MSKIQARVLKGFRDYHPSEMLPKRRMLNTIASTFEAFGFAPLATPALEYSECLLGKYGDEGDKLLYRFRDNGDRDVAMRYDLTVPLARFVAMNGQLIRPFKRYQIAPVWRAEKPGRGRFREFSQCDVDIVGSADLMADAECLAVGAAVLEGLGAGDFVIRINNRKLLTAMLQRFQITEGAEAMSVLRAVDKLPKIGEAAVRGMLRDENGLSEAAVDGVFEFLALPVEALDDWFAGDDLGREGAAELTKVLELADEMSVGHRVEIDLSIARGLDYYTGTIYETFLCADEGLGSVMSGGRYDNLLSMFGGQDVPAVGISLGVDRLFYGLTELGLLQEQKSPSKVLVGVFSDAERALSYSVAGALRGAGINTEVFPGIPRMKKQLQYANRQGIPYVVLVGESEAERNEVILKEMSTGDQVAMTVEALIERINQA